MFYLKATVLAAVIVIVLGRAAAWINSIPTP